MNDTQPAPRPEFVDKSSSRVRVYTPSGVLEGSHHHPPQVRLSDMLRNQASTEKYMLLTDVEIQHVDGSSLKAAFVLVSTAHASVIVPLDEG
jgi:hypothetical protein